MPSSSGSAELVISRERSWTGSLLPWAVLVDGRKLGTVSNGGSLTVPMAPGHHTVVVSPPAVVARSVAQSQPFAFDAEAGGRIELVTKSPALGRPRIWRLGTPPGRSGLADLVGRTTARQAAEQFPDAPVSPPPASRPTTTANPAAVTSCTIVEGDRYAVPLGGETRTIDNSKSTSATMRVVRLTREWARTYIVDAEQATTVHGSAGLGAGVLALKAEAQRTLSKRYSTTTEERETFAEEVTLNIAAHTRSEIVFSWKEIRQAGVVRVAGEGFEAQIPYEAVVGLTFDQQQVDVT
jgi:hypothetical protein